MPEPLKNSSGSKVIEGASVICGVEALFVTGGDSTACVEAGKEFCRDGVPISGDVIGKVEARRLLGR